MPRSTSSSGRNRANSAGLSGCSGITGTVQGKVTADGKAVTAGTIVLSPLDADGRAAKGPPGMAEVGPNGEFTMTLEAGPGGLANRFSVRYAPPPVQATSKTKNVVVPFAGLGPKEREVTINPGANVVEVQLVPLKK